MDVTQGEWVIDSEISVVTCPTKLRDVCQISSMITENLNKQLKLKLKCLIEERMLLSIR